MDPGEIAASQRTLDVILDVVRRYDVDGVHIDDYFYPYPVPAIPGNPVTENSPEVDFPDEPSWSRYVLGGGKLGRADWRRQNVNDLVERIHLSVHREKPWMRFGVSPFGLGRPDRRPAGITGFSQYDKLYADVELWLAKGWMDYLAPQLYWPIDQPQQAFGPLMEYWISQNTAGRHIWPGMFTSRIDNSPKSWKPEEIVNQIALMRTRKTVTGHVHFSMITLMEDRQGINARLKATYATPALIPAFPGYSHAKPATPTVILTRPGPDDGTIIVNVVSDAACRRLAMWVRSGTTWTLQLKGASSASSGQTGTPLASGTALRVRMPDALSVSCVDRVGNESDGVTLTADELARVK